MQLIFTHHTSPKFTKSGNYGGMMPAKQRVGQPNNTMAKTFTVTLPDKVNMLWYEQLNKALLGVKLNSLRHEVKVVDTTEFLQPGYNRIFAEQGCKYMTLIMNPTQDTFVTTLGKGIKILKSIARQYINGY